MFRLYRRSRFYRGHRWLSWLVVSPSPHRDAGRERGREREGGGEAALSQKRRGGSAGAGNAQPELGMGAQQEPWSRAGWRNCPTGAFGALGAAMGLAAGRAAALRNVQS